MSAPGRAPTVTVARSRRIQIDEARLLRRIDELGRIGATAEGGVHRLGFSAEDVQAQNHLRAEAFGAGLCSRVDAAGNVLISRDPEPQRWPAVLIGSHLDTVADGGRLDGAYGVIAALEVLQTVTDAGLGLANEPVAVAFANEEGALFPQPFWGSTALSGQSDQLPTDPRDNQGNPLSGPLRAAGGNLAELRGAAWPAGTVKAYLELHIEQGPVLEDLGLPIGVVTDIVGRVAFDVRVHGAAGHAGTTPMARRRDAAVAASHAVLTAERLAGNDNRCRVATAGRLGVRPGSTNVIPGTAFVSVEFRDESSVRLDEVAAVFLTELDAIADRTGCEIRVEQTLRSSPVTTDPALRDVIAGCAGRLGLGHTRLPSGAGHDAQLMAAVAPIGMIFVPSRNGVSHVPTEDTAPADLTAGANVLLQATVQLTEQPR